MMTMNKQNKELLLKELSARLPYGVKILIDSEFLREKGLDVQTLIGVDLSLMIVLAEHNWYNPEKIKPYLRPMSSMTEEEESINEQLLRDMHFKPRVSTASHYMNFLYEHHIDFDGWIEKGLAMPAPEGMYYFI